MSARPRSLCSRDSLRDQTSSSNSAPSSAFDVETKYNLCLLNHAERSQLMQQVCLANLESKYNVVLQSKKDARSRNLLLSQQKAGTGCPETKRENRQSRNFGEEVNKSLVSYEVAHSSYTWPSPHAVAGSKPALSKALHPGIEGCSQVPPSRGPLLVAPLSEHLSPRCRGGNVANSDSFAGQRMQSAGDGGPQVCGVTQMTSLKSNITRHIVRPATEQTRIMPQKALNDGVLAQTFARKLESSQLSTHVRRLKAPAKEGCVFSKRKLLARDQNCVLETPGSEKYSQTSYLKYRVTGAHFPHENAAISQSHCQLAVCNSITLKRKYGYSAITHPKHHSLGLSSGISTSDHEFSEKQRPSPVQLKTHVNNTTEECLTILPHRSSAPIELSSFIPLGDPDTQHGNEASVALEQCTVESVLSVFSDSHQDETLLHSQEVHITGAGPLGEPLCIEGSTDSLSRNHSRCNIDDNAAASFKHATDADKHLQTTRGIDTPKKYKESLTSKYNKILSLRSVSRHIDDARNSNICAAGFDFIRRNQRAKKSPERPKYSCLSTVAREYPSTSDLTHRPQSAMGELHSTVRPLSPQYSNHGLMTAGSVQLFDRDCSHESFLRQDARILPSSNLSALQSPSSRARVVENAQRSLGLRQQPSFVSTYLKREISSSSHSPVHDTANQLAANVTRKCGASLGPPPRASKRGGGAYGSPSPLFNTGQRAPSPTYHEIALDQALISTQSLLHTYRRPVSVEPMGPHTIVRLRTPPRIGRANSALRAN